MDTDPSAAFCANMRSAREARRLSQAGLGKRLAKLGLNWTQTQVQRVEVGLRRVDLTEAHTIARALDTSVQALLIGESADADTGVVDEIRRAVEAVTDAAKAVDDAGTELHRHSQRYDRAKHYLASLDPAALPDGPLRSAALAALSPLAGPVESD